MRGLNNSSSPTNGDLNECAIDAARLVCDDADELRPDDGADLRGGRCSKLTLNDRLNAEVDGSVRRRTITSAPPR